MPHPALKAFRDAVLAHGGTVNSMLTYYDQERQGRVMEVRAFFPGQSGYDLTPDDVPGTTDETA